MKPRSPATIATSFPTTLRQSERAFSSFFTQLFDSDFPLSRADVKLKVRGTRMDSPLRAQDCNRSVIFSPLPSDSSIWVGDLPLDAQSIAPETAPDKHVVAFMDIGTNSVRMILARIHPNHTYSIISQQKEVVRLGEGSFGRNSCNRRPCGGRRSCAVNLPEWLARTGPRP